jgi:hypothetical protein
MAREPVQHLNQVTVYPIHESTVAVYRSDRRQFRMRTVECL